MPRKLTQEQFIEKSMKFHGNRYDYSECIYVSQKKSVRIICKTHGGFEQLPTNHLRYGCWKCRIPRSSLSFDEFIKRARKIHYDKYIYDEKSYKSVSAKIAIICPKHGEYLQRGSDHLQGKGCRTCMGEQAKSRYISNRDEFIEKAVVVFGKRYCYDKVIYEGNKNYVIINCQKHGDFSMSPNNHLRGHGCPICGNSPISAISQKWLDLLGVPKEYREKKLNIGEQIITVDAYDPGTNTVFEFWGDFWHGNPKVFKQTDINYRSKKLFGELYENTMVRRTAIIEAGYNLVEIWENEFNRKNHPNCIYRGTRLWKEYTSC
jgi:hypothetical protein